MRPSAAFALALSLAAAGAARAAELEVVVRNGRGAPVPDVVVTVAPAHARATPARFDQPLTMTQKDRQFSPFILVAPRGAEVRFPNEDPLKHQVYSFSPAKAFELKLYGRDQTRSVRFDKAGVVALGCNIHDAMVAYIDVVDAPFAAKTDARGRVDFSDVPTGSALVRAWHPYMRAPDAAQTATVTVPASGAAHAQFTADLRTPAMRMSSY